MKLPKIGETITISWARDLCQHFGFEYLVKRIDEAKPGEFKEWVFDGASMTPDQLVSRLAHIPHLTEIALKHDPKYAFGEPGNKQEKAKADQEFRQDLLNDGASTVMAEAMFVAVDVFGDGLIKTSFTWGFARTRR